MRGVDWVGAGGLYHAAVNGSAICGFPLGGVALAEHPCEACVAEILGALRRIPGLDVLA